MTTAEDFHRLFAGLDRSHGRYSVPQGARPNGEGKLHDSTWAKTVSGAVTPELWAEHLEGTVGLGVVPIRDDATCVFGAIDVDPHDRKGNYAPIADLGAFRARSAALGLPLAVCRTKSGGAHLYLFLTSPASAELVRGKLMEFAVAIGHPGAEVFPKQTRLASEADHGSWINVPYNGGRRSTRYAVGEDGRALTPEEFVAEAGRLAVDPDELRYLEPEVAEGLDALEGAPPCLQVLAPGGFAGWENNGLFNLAVYARKRFPDSWQEKVLGYNGTLVAAPVTAAAVTAMIRSVGKKSYTYMCKQEPICNVCNRTVCLTRDFGVGGLASDPGVVFGELLKVETDPPTYIWDVDGARIELAVEDLMDQRRFQRLAITVLDKWPTTVKPAAWLEIVRDRLSRVEHATVPEDSSREGQFWVHAARFCTSRVQGRSLDELLLGKPFTDGGRTYFCSTDLLAYLGQHRFAGVTEREVYRWLRKRGVAHHSGKLKGKFVNWWSLPAFPEQTEEHDVPRAPITERM